MKKTMKKKERRRGDKVMKKELMKRGIKKKNYGPMKMKELKRD